MVSPSGSSGPRSVFRSAPNTTSAAVPNSIVAMERPLYSFVVPVYNEEQTLPELYGRLCRVLSILDGRSELLFIDDGSTDRSFEMMIELQKDAPRVCPIRFSRNFGHQVAISAGIDHA